MSMMTAKAMMVSGMPVLTKVLASKVSVLNATMFWGGVHRQDEAEAHDVLEYHGHAHHVEGRLL